ncbi:hypothetical protein CPB83DRAFT_849244 [Crepidotus variabilis]|uniref:No apical meristem-associated C-terminal domain-containing protein n=1 Tax=Crepidotus variabilis TaxID=179855 RepID=A0A9P6JT00_9AGAR|nr:hypothetical protein CPB83DRAFT_849244 [Crepidotus variabilis]
MSSDESDTIFVKNRSRGRKVCIAWSKDASKDARLLDWIDSHQHYRDILFSSFQGGTRRVDRNKPSKKKCCTMIAQSIFEFDDDNSIRRAVVDDPDYYGTLVYAHITHLKTEYQNIIRAIGATAANMHPEEFIDGTDASKNLERHLRGFSLWKRLHLHWRTLSHFNELYSDKEPSKGDGKVNILSKSRDLVQPSDISQVNTRASPARTKKLIVIDEPSDGEHAASKPESLGTQKLKCMKKRKFSLNDDIKSGVAALAQTEVGVPPSNDVRLAELAVKRQKLENEAIEKKAETRRVELGIEERLRAAKIERAREKERHEFMMKLMEMAMPSQGLSHRSQYFLKAPTV